MMTLNPVGGTFHPGQGMVMMGGPQNGQQNVGGGKLWGCI